MTIMQEFGEIEEKTNLLKHIMDNPYQAKKFDPQCEYCEGTGERVVANGPDDVDKVECDCYQDLEEHKP